MRVVLQRVQEASVKVNGNITGAINQGLLVLAGFEEGDTLEDFEWMSRKITQLRIFNDDDGVMNVSLLDKDFDILLVSQFTLHASTKKGNRPSYIQAAKPDVAINLYQHFQHTLENLLGKTVPTGIFGADMQVHLINDGPVTLIIDSKQRS